MDFIALDVETANAGQAGICQVGIVTFRDEQVVDQWQTPVNPGDYFDSIRYHSWHCVTHTFSNIHQLTEYLSAIPPMSH